MIKSFLIHILVSLVVGYLLVICYEVMHGHDLVPPGMVLSDVLERLFVEYTAGVAIMYLYGAFCSYPRFLFLLSLVTLGVWAVAIKNPTKTGFLWAHGVYAFLAYVPIIGFVFEVIPYCGE